MFRRSRSSSSSNIPLAKPILTNVHKPLLLRRSNSSSNLLQVPTRDSRPRSITRDTPQSLFQVPTRDSRSRSITRGTPQSSSSYGVNRPSTTPVFSQRRTPLKNDKKNIQDNYWMVQNFICTSCLFDPTIANGNNIKPPTLKTFIYIINVLLKQIFHKIDITNENYKEVIPRHLKLLKYPGSISLSLLKTVNTMHSWPQIMALFAWLINLVSIFIKDPDNDEEGIIQIGCNYLKESYYHYNSTASEEGQSEILKKYSDKIATALNVDVSKYNELVKDVENLTTKNFITSEKLQVIQHRTKTVENENEDMLNEIAMLEEKLGIKGNSLDDQIVQLERKCREGSEKVRIEKEQVKELKGIVQNQKYSVKDKESLLQSIATLKHEKEMSKEYTDTWKEVKDKYDKDLADLIRKITEKIQMWNKTIIKEEFEIQLLRQKAFYEPTFLQEIQTVKNEFNTVNQDNQKLLDGLKAKLLQQEENMKRMENEEKIIRKKNQITTSKLEECKQQIIAIEEELKQIEVQKNIEKGILVDQLNKLVAQMDDKKQKLEELKASQLQVQKKYDDLSKDSIAFFIRLNKIFATNIGEMDKIMATAVQALYEGVVADVDQLKRINKALDM